MGRMWIDTAGPEDADQRVDVYCGRMGEDVQHGQFWSEQIKQYRNDPNKRLAAALNELPLPGAFGEAGIALRALIRAKRKAKEPYDSHLAFLYWLAAVQSLSVPYSERLKQPVFNIMQSIPGDRIKGLKIEYRTLGYKRIGLGVTAEKWLIEAWGEPDAHSTLHELHHDLWREFEDRLIEKERLRWVDFEGNVLGHLPVQAESSEIRVEPTAPVKRKGFLAHLFGR